MCHMTGKKLRFCTMVMGREGQAACCKEGRAMWSGSNPESFVEVVLQLALGKG